MKKYIVPAIIEQHIHGGFGVNFNTCNIEDVLFFLNKIKAFGVSKVYPTLHTDSYENLNRQIKIIYESSKAETDVKIMGVHLEGPFINPQKAGVHNLELIKKPKIDDYKKITEGIDEDFIKIVTLAPELDDNFELTNYLKKKRVVVSAGHTISNNLLKMDMVTHLFNAMEGISHKKSTTSLEAIMNDNIYTEIIADGNHVVDEVLNLFFKVKPKDKIILISDALPISHSKNNVEIFMGKKIYLNNTCAKTADGVLAGSALFVFDIIKKLVKNNILDMETAFNMASKNVAELLQIEHASMLEINENFEVLS